MPILRRAMRARMARAPRRQSAASESGLKSRASRGTAVALAVAVTASIEHDRFRPAPAVKASISGDGLVLLDVSGGLILSSNVVGARIWQLLVQRHRRPDIARSLAGEYAIPLERAERDVAAFVAALIARGLVIADTRP